MIDQSIVDFRAEDVYAALLNVDNLRVEQEFPMAKITSFGAGGPADLAVFPETEDALISALSVADKYSQPITVLGRCSNVLVSDLGIRGVTVILGQNYAHISNEGSLWHCTAGVPMFKIAARVAKAGYGGAEFLCGIPGSLGGAVVMNAGAYDGAMEDIVESVVFIDEKRSLRKLTFAELNLSYRHSYFTDNPGIISRIDLRLNPKISQEIYARMHEIQSKRRKSQPLDKKSGGSSFKRPEGAYAAKLIEDSGLKGWTKGKVGVSGKHSGFIVNYGGASATEIAEVFNHVREVVYRKTGIRLEPEVKKIGEW